MLQLRAPPGAEDPRRPRRTAVPYLQPRAETRRPGETRIALMHRLLHYIQDSKAKQSRAKRGGKKGTGSKVKQGRGTRTVCDVQCTTSTIPRAYIQPCIYDAQLNERETEKRRRSSKSTLILPVSCRAELFSLQTSQ